MSKEHLYINSNLAHRFLFIILLGFLAMTMWTIRSFLIDIILAGVIASFFYPVFKFILRRIGDKKKRTAALLTTLIIALLVLAPLTNFFYYLIKKSIEAYGIYSQQLSASGFFDTDFASKLDFLPFFDANNINLGEYIAKFAQGVNSMLINLSTTVLRETTRMITSFLVILMTVFFLFVEGKNFARKIMNLTPLPNKYDAQLFKTFREISSSTMLSTFVVAVFQGLVGGIGFWLVGLPAFFPGVLMAVSSILPYVGAALVWIPAVIYLFATGQIINGIVLTVIGFIISLGDNVLRAFLIKGKSQIHELIVFFAIIGGVLTFGFWGIVLGPLLIAFLITVIDIYEQEYKGQLDVTSE